MNNVTSIPITGSRSGGFALTVMAACVSTIALISSATAAEFEFRLGHPLQPTDATQTAMVSFADGVRERTDGRVEIEVFPSDQLGAQKDVGEMLVQGASVIQFTDFLFLAQWVPDTAVLQAPFLLSDLNDWYTLIESDWFAGIEDQLAAKNIRILSKNSYFGSRSIIGPKAIRSPADIAGENIREANAQMYVEMAKSWGARPVVVNFSEVYTALSQGVVDFVEVPPQTMVSSKFTEQRKVVSLTNHMVGWSPVIISESTFSALPEDIQAIMIEEAAKAGDLLSELKRAGDKEIVATLREMGITVIEDIDQKAFQDASAAAYESFTEWTPGLAATVRAAAGE
ncbi:MAG: TRAP transporter substrate-binding protein DctP [Rhizobiales bacterium]|nr:TRAP transporter substrate-binding protein DctP [Hyphomicrobiales bacterium]